jgi:anthranilate 1,2-dioxygenase small subunit
MALTPSIPAETRFALSDFFEHYADVVDSGRFDQWENFFVEDCAYRVTSRQNHQEGLAYGAIYCDGIGMIRDRANALRDSTYYEPRTMRHLIGTPKVVSNADGQLKTRTSFLIVESLADAEPTLFMVGEYHDTIVESAGALRLKERFCVYDNARVLNSLIYPV